MPSLWNVSFDLYKSLLICIGLFWCGWVSFHVYGSLLPCWLVSSQVPHTRRCCMSFSIDIGLFWFIQVSFHLFGSLLTYGVIAGTTHKSLLHVSFYFYRPLLIHTGLFWFMQVSFCFGGSFLTSCLVHGDISDITKLISWIFRSYFAYLSLMTAYCIWSVV